MIDDVRNVTSVVVSSITAVSFHDNAASRPTPSSLADATPAALLQGTAPMPTAQTWAAIYERGTSDAHTHAETQINFFDIYENVWRSATCNVKTK